MILRMGAKILHKSAIFTALSSGIRMVYDRHETGDFLQANDTNCDHVPGSHLPLAPTFHVTGVPQEKLALMSVYYSAHEERSR